MIKKFALLLAGILALISLIMSAACSTVPAETAVALAEKQVEGKALWVSTDNSSSVTTIIICNKFGFVQVAKVSGSASNPVVDAPTNAIAAACGEAQELWNNYQVALAGPYGGAAAKERMLALKDVIK